jgi:hypothetical protein
MAERRLQGNITILLIQKRINIFFLKSYVCQNLPLPHLLLQKIDYADRTISQPGETIRTVIFPVNNPGLIRVPGILIHIILDRLPTITTKIPHNFFIPGTQKYL